MNRYQTYLLTGRILSLDYQAGNATALIRLLQEKNISWERFVALADHHLVLQALYPKIRDHNLQDYFPGEVLDHLKYIFKLTTARNIDIIRQSEKLAFTLRSAGVIPLFMKGVGIILDGVCKYPGERILHDIDILVPSEKFEYSAEILLDYGYRSQYKYDSSDMNQKRHYPILFKPGEPVYVELHRIPSGKRFTKVFNTEMVFSQAKKPAACSDCLVMSDEHKIIHNFIHAQLDHRAHIFAREFMRNLYDMLLLSARKDPETVLSGFGKYRLISSGYLDIFYDTFGITPSYRNTPGLFLHTYRFRYYLNLRYRFIGIASLFLTRIFLGWIVKPLKATGNKEIRKNLVYNLRNPAWYKKQASYYKKVLGMGRTVNRQE